MQGQSSRPLIIRIVVIAFGVFLLALGVLGWFLPLMPGWFFIFGGLAVLADEFTWADDLLDKARRRLARIRRQAPDDDV